MEFSLPTKIPITIFEKVIKHVSKVIYFQGCIHFPEVDNNRDSDNKHIKRLKHIEYTLQVTGKNEMTSQYRKISGVEKEDKLSFSKPITLLRLFDETEENVFYGFRNGEYTTEYYTYVRCLTCAIFNDIISMIENKKLFAMGLIDDTSTLSSLSGNTRLYDIHLAKLVYSYII